MDKKKKAFFIHCDLLEKIEVLTDEQCGILFTEILKGKIESFEDLAQYIEEV